jgi:hypothetical protein
VGKTTHWGVAAEYRYGGTLGGRGDVDGSYENTGTLFLATYYNWKF